VSFKEQTPYLKHTSANKLKMHIKIRFLIIIIIIITAGIVKAGRKLDDDN